MSLSIRNAAANARQDNDNGGESTSSYCQSEEGHFEITNTENFSIKPFTCWDNFVIPIGSYFTCFGKFFGCCWNVLQLISCCLFNPHGSNFERAHIVFLDWISFINLLWLKTDKCIVLLNIKIELLTEFSLINWVLWWCRVLKVSFSRSSWVNFWLSQNCNILIETILFSLNNDVTISLISGYMIFTVPVFGCSVWSWLIFTPGPLSFGPYSIFTIFRSSYCDENIFLSWAFIFSLWAGPLL